MKNTLVRLVAVVGCLVIGGLFSPVHGAVLFFDNFEADTIGQNPAGWTINEAPPNSDISVVAGSSTGGSGANQQLLSIQNNSVSGFYNVNHTFTGTNLVQATFSIRFDSVATQSDVRFGIDGVGAGTYLRARNKISGFSDGFTFYNSGFQATAITDIKEGDWYRVVLQASITSGSWSYSISNLNSSAVGQVASGGGIPFFASQTSLTQFNFAQIAPGGQFEVDDVFVEVPLPEPTAAALMACGLGMLAGWRRRHRL